MVDKITLTKEQTRFLKDLDAVIARAREELERAKRVGIDVTVLEQELNKAIALRDNLLKEYGHPEEL